MMRRARSPIIEASVTTSGSIGLEALWSASETHPGVARWPTLRIAVLQALDPDSETQLGDQK